MTMGMKRRLTSPSARPVSRPQSWRSTGCASTDRRSCSQTARGSKRTVGPQATITPYAGRGLLEPSIQRRLFVNSATAQRWFARGDAWESGSRLSVRRTEAT